MSDRRDGKVQPAVLGFSTFSFSLLPECQRLSLPKGRNSLSERKASGLE